MDILVNTYPREEAIKNPADMWKYIKELGGDTNRTLVQVVKEHLEVEEISQVRTPTIKIS